jgi:AcrR family transcriptional regulator
MSSRIQTVSYNDIPYHRHVPKLWNATLEAHRHDVREAILDTTWALVSERGLLAVSMSGIAEEVGIGRATLYKYFPDVEAILAAWHERHVAAHLAHLTALAGENGPAVRRLESVLRGYAQICRHRAEHGTEELSVLLHRGDQVAAGHHRLHALFRDLVAEAAAAGDVRDDVPAAELATYCLHALAAAGQLGSGSAVDRLVGVTLASLGVER